MGGLLDVNVATDNPSLARILEDCRKFENTVEVGRTSPKEGVPERGEHRDRAPRSQVFGTGLG
jgi:hypothetical protein